MVWKRSKPSEKSGQWSGFLERAVRFDGTIEVPGTFRLEAEVKGHIVSTGTLTLGEGARVEGQINGNHVVISGRFDGVIFANLRVDILSTGVVTGEIHPPCVVIEPSGIFVGQC